MNIEEIEPHEEFNIISIFCSILLHYTVNIHPVLFNLFVYFCEIHVGG